MTCEFPLEGLSHGFVVGLKCEQALFDGGQRWEVVGCKYLALDNGKVDLDLIEPTGMDGTMHGARPAMRGAIVHDPEDPASLVVGRLVHDVVDESLKRRDAGLALTAAKHFGAVDIECGQVEGNVGLTSQPNWFGARWM